MHDPIQTKSEYPPNAISNLYFCDDHKHDKDLALSLLLSLRFKVSLPNLYFSFQMHSMLIAVQFEPDSYNMKPKITDRVNVNIFSMQALEKDLIKNEGFNFEPSVITALHALCRISNHCNH